MMGWRDLMSMPHWTRHALFVAINLAMAGFVYVGIVLPVSGLFGETNQSIAERQAILAHYNAIIAKEPLVRAYAAQVKDSNSRGELIAGPSEGVANANLQSRLKTLAEAAEATVRSVQTLPPKTIRGEALVGARIEIRGTIQSIAATLQTIEAGLPLLIVTSATLRPSVSMRFMPGMSDDSTVEAQFDVYAGASQRDKS